MAPTDVLRLITIPSRWGSMAGFVTCANCCLKWSASGSASFREHRQRRVVAHRADRLGAVTGHRGQHQLDLLGGLAESSLHSSQSGGQDRRHRLRRQVVEEHLVVGQPAGVGPPGRQLALDLGVVHHPAPLGVDGQHPPRLEPAGLGDLFRVDGQHADLRGQHDQPVARAQPPSRPQPVAVEGRHHPPAVGRDHGRRAVPWLDQAGVELVEGAHVGGQVERRVGPGRWDQHRQRMRQRSAGHHQQLERSIELGGIRPALLEHREQLLQVTAQQLALELRLPRRQPAGVPANGVDLAVVGQQVERVGQIPRAQRVGREAGVDERQPALETGVAELRVERAQLCRAEQPLVHEPPGRQADDRELRLRDRRLHGGPLHPPADHVERPLEGLLVARPPLHDQHPDHRRGAGRHPADLVRPHGHVAPAQRAVPLLGADADAQLLAAQAPAGVAGKEHQSGRVGAGRRQLELELAAAGAAQEAVGLLDGDAGAVAGLGIGAGGPSVVEVGERHQGQPHQLVCRSPVEAHERAQSAGVVLEASLVKSLAHQLNVPETEPRES